MSANDDEPPEPHFGEHADEAAPARDRSRSDEAEGEGKPREAIDPSTFSPERAPDDAGA
jgi:hypothetical protein